MTVNRLAFTSFSDQLTPAIACLATSLTSYDSSHLWKLGLLVTAIISRGVSNGWCVTYSETDLFLQTIYDNSS